MSVPIPERPGRFDELAAFKDAVDQKLYLGKHHVTIKTEVQETDHGAVQVLRVRAKGRGVLGKLSEKQKGKERMVANTVQLTLKDCLKEFLRTAGTGPKLQDQAFEELGWLQDGLRQYDIFVGNVKHLAGDRSELLLALKNNLAAGVHEFLMEAGQLTGDTEVDKELVRYVINGGQVGRIRDHGRVLPRPTAVNSCRLALQELLKRTPEQVKAGKLPRRETHEQPEAVKKRGVRRRKSTKRLTRRRQSTKRNLRESKAVQEAKQKVPGGQ